MVDNYQDINELDVIKLEQILEEYPWFSLARVNLLIELSKVGKEYFNNNFRDTLAFVQSQDNILKKINSLPVEQFADSTSKRDNKLKNFYIVGGDYFSTDDLSSIDDSKESEVIEKVGEFVPKSEQGPIVDYTIHEVSISEEDFNSLEFYTETLAKIFIDQEYYDQAIDVYEKLSLLYPEKSVYFASLINELKLKKL